MGNFVTGSRDTSASAVRVWELLVEVERWPDNFTPHLKAAYLDGPLREGASGWVKTRLPLPRAPFTITAVNEGRSWAWRGKLLWLTMDFDHRIDPSVAGCRVTFDVDLDGPLAAVVRPLARLAYRPQMERALDLLTEQAQNR